MTSPSGPSNILCPHAGRCVHSGRGVLKSKCRDYTNGKRMGLFRWVSAEAVELAEEERAGIQDRKSQRRERAEKQRKAVR